MKKLIYTFLILGTFILTSCSNDVGERSIYNEVNNLEGVSLELDKEEYQVEREIIELTVSNQSDEEITFGAPYELEYLLDENWYKVEADEDIAFIMIAYILAPDEEHKEDISLEFYEPLETGRYRIIKLIGEEVLAVEFEVTE